MRLQFCLLVGIAVACSIRPVSAQGFGELGLLKGFGVGVGAGLGTAAALKSAPKSGSTGESDRYCDEAEKAEKSGKTADAIFLYNKALTARGAGPKDLGSQRILECLANLYCRQSDFANSEKCLRQALAISARRDGPGSPEAAPILNSLGAVSVEMKKFPQAQSTVKQSLMILERYNGIDHAETLKTRLALASAYAMDGQFGPAESLLKQNMALLEKANHTADATYATSATQLAEVLRKMNRPEDAAALENKVKTTQVPVQK